jgi:hypothetical protein
MTNFLDAIGNIFQFGEVPMRKQPSVVKLGEGEELVMDTGPKAPMTHGPNGLFGDTYGGGDMPHPDQMPPTPEETMAAHREQYAMPNPLVMQEELADAQMPNGPALGELSPQMEVPPMPSIDPELNETVQEIAGQDGVPPPEGYEEYQDEDGNTKIRRIEGVPANPQDPHRDGYGMPATKPDDRSPAAENGKRTAVEAWSLREHGSRNPAGLESPLTEEEAAVVDEAVSGMPTAPDPDALPDVDTTPPVMVKTPDGNEVEVTQETVQQVAEEDPTGFSKAMGWITRTFGVTGQDLAKFAALYAGSRLAGYDHQGSMSWSFEVAGTDLQERRKLHTTMANSGKYTPASLEEYNKTGDFSKLKAVSDPKDQVKVDRTSPKLTRDGSKVVYPATLPNGSKVHVDANGNPYSGFVKDPEDPESNRELYEEYEPKVASIAKELTDPGIGKDGKKLPSWYSGSETVDAALATEFALAWAIEEGIPPNSAAFGNIVGGAYQQARRWAQASGETVTSIQPFLDQQKVYITSSDAWAGALQNPDGSKLDVEQFGQISNNLMGVLSQDKLFEEAAKRANKGTMLSWAMKALYADYEALPQEQKAVYARQGGFKGFLEEATLNPFDN